ncbi:MAG: D-glycero-beta-D-manno-heptose 1,7-bisphosphate 7-phosphatase [Legionellales bacterium]|nr:D-glycero-beta-D-manno-heptose 1,7-bisphosphate 7-phosphatase [Legionellales bacterium]
MDKYILLDRDGVVNYDSDDYIKSPNEWNPIEGSLASIAKLNKAGYHVVIITNQAGVARGLFSIETLHAIHEKMRSELTKVNGSILDIFYCPHHPDDNCVCRKPKPGLLLQFAEKYTVDLSTVNMVGDNIKDVLAAQSVNVTPQFVLTNPHVDINSTHLQGVSKYKNLADFVEHFLR